MTDIDKIIKKNLISEALSYERITHAWLHLDKFVLNVYNFLKKNNTLNVILIFTLVLKFACYRYQNYSDFNISNSSQSDLYVFVDSMLMKTVDMLAEEKIIKSKDKHVIKKRLYLELVPKNLRLALKSYGYENWIFNNYDISSSLDSLFEFI